MSARRNTRREDSPASEGEQNVDATTCALVANLLGGGLLKKIEEAVERQFEKRGQADCRGSSSRNSGTAEANAHLSEWARQWSDPNSSFRGEMRPGGELIDQFNPDDRQSNVDDWLTEIDQLGEIHGWTEHDRAFFMQSKLRGAARNWYNQLGNYNRSWDEWKASLSEAFPRYHNFGAIVAETVARVKEPGETMSNYFYSKLELCYRCDITGEKAVSMIIHGLPESLKARAIHFKTPEELYTKYLAAFDEYEAESLGRSGKRSVSSGREVAVARPKIPRTDTSRDYPVARRDDRPRAKRDDRSRARCDDRPRARCFNCQEYTTHLSRDCPKPRVDRCARCRRPGHMATECPETQ